MANAQQNLNIKAQKFQSFLDAQQIKCFRTEQAADGLNSAVFRSVMEINGTSLPAAVILDDSIYGMLRVQVVPRAVRESNEQALLAYINEENRKYKVFKYYLAENGDLCLDACVVLNNEQENGPALYAVIDVVLKHLQENYPAVMAKVWGK